MNCNKCGDEITNENGGHGTAEYAVCHNCEPLKIEVVCQE